MPSTRNSFEFLDTVTEISPQADPNVPQAVKTTSPNPPPDSPPKPQSNGIQIGLVNAPFKDPYWKPNGMDVDCIPNQPEAGSSQAQVMDEESKIIDLRGLDILELEQACRKNNLARLQTIR